MKILHLDSNHPILLEKLQAKGYTNDLDFTSSKEEIESIIHQYDGIVIRSRFKIDRTFIDKATQLKFIARVGAGLESIDCEYAQQKNIQLIAAPEGNRNAVGEHALGMILMLFNKLHLANQSVKNGQWEREKHRGLELEGKTIGIIGYGNMGQSFAKKLSGFEVKEVIFYDIEQKPDSPYAKQVSLEELFEKTDILSLHTPWTPLTNKMVDANFIAQFKKPFWLINTARGKSVVTADLVQALEQGKIVGAALDVLEYEKLSFERMDQDNLPSDLNYLFESNNVVLSPHVAGWTKESHEKLALTIVEKIIASDKN